MSLPDEYLDMSLRTVIALATRSSHPRGTPCEASTVVDAVHALDERIAKEDAARVANDAEWLAHGIEGLTTSLETPAK